MTRVTPPALPRHACWRRRAIACVALAAGGLGAEVPAGAAPSTDDGRQALAAREGGRILPLDALLAQVSQAIPGRLLEAELDDDDGSPVYELRWQLADGRRLEIDIDARNGRWLKLEGPRLETVFRPRAVPGPRAAEPAR